MQNVDQLPPEEQQPSSAEAAEGLPQRAVLWGAVALLALLGLLTSLMSQQPNGAWGPSGVRLMPRLPEPVVYLLLGLFTLAAIAVLAVLFPREVRFRRKKGPDEFQEYHEPPKFSPGVFVVLLLPLLIAIGLIAYLYWQGGVPLVPEQALHQPAPVGPLASRPPELAAEKPAAAAPGFAWTLAILGGLGGLAVVLGGVWFFFGERLARWWYGIAFADETRRALLDAVEISLDDLLHEPDPRRAIIACYRRFEQVLSQHGLPRAPWQTPLEYLRVALERFRLPPARLRRLTALFELAKFSAHPLGQAEKHLAIAVLRQAKATLEEDDHVPAA
jgi:hypothetical protein